MLLRNYEQWMYVIVQSSNQILKIICRPSVLNLIYGVNGLSELWNQDQAKWDFWWFWVVIIYKDASSRARESWSLAEGFEKSDVIGISWLFSKAKQ